MHVWVYLHTSRMIIECTFSVALSSFLAKLHVRKARLSNLFVILLWQNQTVACPTFCCRPQHLSVSPLLFFSTSFRLLRKHNLVVCRRNWNKYKPNCMTLHTKRDFDLAFVESWVFVLLWPLTFSFICMFVPVLRSLVPIVALHFICPGFWTGTALPHVNADWHQINPLRIF